MTWGEINALNVAWHEKYGEMGEFWPSGRGESAAVSVSEKCRHGQHADCIGLRGHRSCECICHVS